MLPLGYGYVLLAPALDIHHVASSTGCAAANTLFTSVTAAVGVTSSACTALRPATGSPYTGSVAVQQPAAGGPFTIRGFLGSTSCAGNATLTFAAALNACSNADNSQASIQLGGLASAVQSYYAPTEATSVALTLPATASAAALTLATMPALMKSQLIGVVAKILNVNIDYVTIVSVTAVGARRARALAASGYTFNFAVNTAALAVAMGKNGFSSSNVAVFAQASLLAAIVTGQMANELNSNPAVVTGLGTPTFTATSMFAATSAIGYSDDGYSDDGYSNVPAVCPAASSTTQAALVALSGQSAYGASYGPTPSYNPSASYGASPTYMPSSTFMPTPSYAPPPDESYAPSPSAHTFLALRQRRQLQPLFGGLLPGVWPPSSQPPRPAFGGSVFDARPFGGRQLQDAAASYAPSPSPAQGYGPTGGYTVGSVYSDSACTSLGSPAVLFYALTGGSTCDSVSTSACTLLPGWSPAAYQNVSACIPNDAIPAPTSGGLWQSVWHSSSSCSGPPSMAGRVYSGACTASGSGSAKTVCTLGGGAQMWAYADSACSGSVTYVFDFAASWAPQGIFLNDSCKDFGAASVKVVCAGAQVAALPPSGGSPGASYAPGPSYGPSPTFAPTLPSLSSCFSGSSRGGARVVSVPDFAPAGARLVACGAVSWLTSVSAGPRPSEAAEGAGAPQTEMVVMKKPPLDLVTLRTLYEWPYETRNPVACVGSSGANPSK